MSGRDDFREDDQAGNDAMQAFWNSPLGREWRQQDEEAIRKLQEEETPRAMAFLLPMDNTKLVRFESTKLEVLKHMESFTAEELQASKTLGEAVVELKKVGGIHWSPEELEQLNEILNDLKALEEQFDTLLVNKYDE